MFLLWTIMNVDEEGPIHGKTNLYVMNVALLEGVFQQW